jgi:hypothetical protein
MLDEKSMTRDLSELGYLRLKRLTYKASWSSTDVEHFLYFSLFSGGYYLACEFGVRNPAAQRFAIECLQLYGGPLFQTFRVDPRFDCPMQFSLGRMAGWPERSSLIVSKMSASALADKVKRDVRDSLFPLIRSVLSAADLFSLLVKDDEPFRWLRVNGALRAAMIVYLGRRIGMQAGEIEAMLQPYLKEIAASVDRVTPEFFLERVLHSN